MSASKPHEEKVSRKAGLPPGSLVHIGKKRSDKTTIEVMDYGPGHLTENTYGSIEPTFQYREKKSISWININGVHQKEIIESIGENFRLHGLLLEGVMNTFQRPKFEEYESCAFFTLKMIGLNPDNDKVVVEQVSFVLGEGFVISFQEQSGDLFNPIRERLRNPQSKVRSRKADYLLYLLLDSVVDNYFVIVEHIGEAIQQIETDVVGDKDTNKVMARIQKYRKQLILLRKNIVPLREAFSRLSRMESNEIQPESVKYYNDVLDHTLQLTDSIETYRDMLNTAMELQMTNVSNRMNQVIQVLTMISTIFIPLTFLAGIYGMNFQYMPELQHKYGYPILLAAMLIIALFMVRYFKRKGWF